MNICVNSKFDCSIDDFRIMVKSFEGEIQNSVSDWKIGVVNDHETIMLLNVTDMDQFVALMHSPRMKQWDADNNCTDLVYSLEQQN